MFERKHILGLNTNCWTSFFFFLEMIGDGYVIHSNRSACQPKLLITDWTLSYKYGHPFETQFPAAGVLGTFFFK